MIGLGANPEGNQLDVKLLSDGNDDVSYDVSFESKASKHQDSYHVELKIPFGVLQFKQAPEMKWNYQNSMKSLLVSFTAFSIVKNQL